MLFGLLSTPYYFSHSLYLDLHSQELDVVAFAVSGGSIPVVSLFRPFAAWSCCFGTRERSWRGL